MIAIAPQPNQTLTGFDAFEAFCQALGITEGTEFLCAYGEENKLTLKARKLEEGLVAWQVYKKNNYQGRGFGKLYRYEGLRELAKIQNLFFIPSLTTTGRSNACVNKPARYLYAEIDDLAIDEQRQKWGEFYQRSGLKPLAQVHTGNKSDHHYIGVKTDSLEEWAYLQKWLCASLDADPAPTSPHQPMRVAGFSRIKNGTEREVSLLQSNPDTYYTTEEIRAAFDKAWPYSEPFSLERWEKYRSAVAIATNPTIDNSRMAPMSEPADAFRLSDGELFPQGKTKTKNRQQGENPTTYATDKKSSSGFLDELIKPLLDLPLETQYSLSNYNHQFQAKAPGLVGCSPWSPTNDSGESFKVFSDNGGWFCHASQQGGGLMQYLQLQWGGKPWGEMDSGERKSFIRKLEKISYWTTFASKAGTQLEYSQGESHWREKIEATLAAQQLLTGRVEVGTFSELQISSERQLSVLDGQKGTRKTSKALKSLIEMCKRLGLTAAVITPTRLLNRNASSVFGIPTINQIKLLSGEPVPFVIACPESAHKLSHLKFDVVLVDEVNECVERVLEGNLGNQPAGSRREFKRLLSEAKMVAIANDNLYRASLKHVQRVGNFTADQIKIIRRRRPQTEMEIILYEDNYSSSERWDGTDANPIENMAFYDCLNVLMGFARKRARVSIPCGSQERARNMARLVKPCYPSSQKGQTFDGKYTPKIVKEAFAASPDAWLERENVGPMTFTPTFNSGLSIESDYFEEQVEFHSAFEPASAASQRGERVRDAIWGKKIKERHVYTSSRGLARRPDSDLFFPEYWAKFLQLDLVERSHVIEEETANRLGAGAVFKDVRDIELKNFEDIQELPEFLAIRAREVYFKTEALKREWRSNGWNIKEGVTATSEEREELRELYQQVEQEIIEQKARILALSRGAAVTEGVEPEGPIHAAKIFKAELGHKLGADFYRLKDATWLEAWAIAPGNNSLEQQQLRALLKLAQTKPELFAEMRRFKILRTIGKIHNITTETNLPISNRQMERAELLSQCPELLQLIDGEMEQWDKNTPEIIAIAQFARENNRPLATLSSHSQRIHGLQFNSSTNDLKCAHKLLKMVGLEPVCVDRKGKTRMSIYAFQKLDDISEAYQEKLNFEQPAYDLRRKVTQYETVDELLGQFSTTLQNQISQSLPHWQAFSTKVINRLNLAKEPGDITSVIEDYSLTEVASPPSPPHLLGEWVRWKTSCSAWLLSGIEHGKALIEQVNVYGHQRVIVPLEEISAWWVESCQEEDLVWR